jgi:hypothetical protein
MKERTAYCLPVKEIRTIGPMSDHFCGNRWYRLESVRDVSKETGIDRAVENRFVFVPNPESEAR